MADRPIGFWLKLVDRLIDERFATIIEEHGVTRLQWQLLSVLSAGPSDIGRLDTAIAPFLDGVPADDGLPQTAVHHLAELLESGWVAHDEGIYTITDRGTLAFGALSEVVDGLRDSLAEGLDEHEYRTTVTALETMARNLGWSD